MSILSSTMKRFLIAWLLASLGLVQVPPAAAGSGPVPPCQTCAHCKAEVAPTYSAPGADLNVRVWLGENLDKAWRPPACTGWRNGGATILVAGAGRFHYEGDVDLLLARIAAISKLPTIRYWSVTRGRWHQLFPEAYALATPERSSRRADFSIDELQPDRSLYYWQKESSSAGSAAYQLRILERSPGRLVFEIRNVDPITLAFVTLFEPGEYRFLYFFEKESSEVWNYYSLFRAGDGPSLLASRHEKSYINRAVAVFRYLAGIPTDREPPGAP